MEDFPVSKQALLENKKIQNEIDTFVGSISVDDIYKVPREEDESSDEKMDVEVVWFSRFMEYLFKKNVDNEVDKTKKIIELEKSYESK